MSMSMTIFSINPAFAQELRENPDCISEAVLDPALDEQMARMGYPVERKLNGRPREVLYLEKAWHLIHFALTKQANGGTWPANILLSSGDKLPYDSGYGPSRIVSPPAVKEAAAFLTETSLATEFDKISPETLYAAQIYPVFGNTGYDEWRGLAEAAFEDLVQFMSRAAASGDAILLDLA